MKDTTDFEYINEKNNDILSKEEKHEAILYEIAYQLKRIADNIEGD